MIYKVPPYDPKAPIIVIDIGNTHVTLATLHEDKLKTPLPVATSDEAGFAEAFGAHVEAIGKTKPAATVIASVVPSALERIRGTVADRLDKDPLVVGEAIPLPLDVDVKDPSAIGTDRVCAAAAAYEKLRTGCTIVDFGTAITVDLVNNDGTLLGGAILPGIALQLRALHEYTAVLPEVAPGFPELPYGRDTVEAMQTGVCRGIAGAVRGLVEGYASHLNHWPQVLATGGDVMLMAPHCDFLDTLVEHLTLRGIGVAYQQHMGAFGG